MQNWFKKTKQSKPEFDYFFERDLLVERYQALLEQAGIANEVRNIQEMLEPSWLEDHDLPPLFTRAYSKAKKQQGSAKFLGYRHRLRHVIFAVPDLAFRQQLIACERQFRALKLKSFDLDLSKARQEQNRAGNIKPLEVLWSSLGAGSAVIIGWSLGGAMWGTAAGAFGVVGAVYGALDKLEQKRRAVAASAAGAQQLEETIEEIAEQEVFDSVEEHSGEDWEAKMKKYNT